MGIFDSIEQLAGSALGSGDAAKVAGGFITAAENHPGGLGGLLETMKNNGLADHVNNWTSGQTTQVEPGQVEQGLGTGVVNQIAEHAGVSPAIVTTALSTMLPLIIQHFAPNGQPAAPQGELGGIASQILGKFL
jgi:uncharacterized protein YidB (DUF937 family)